MMLKEKIGKAKIIWSLMYSPYKVPWRPLKRQIIKIKVSELKFSSDGNCFYYIWGQPGPDVNKYDLSTYGKGWALTKDEILKAWENEE